MKFNVLGIAAAVSVGTLLSSVTLASTIGTLTFNNNTHYGYYGFQSTSSQNTKRNVNVPFGGSGNISGIARVVHVTGTVTKVHAEAWLSSIQIQPMGGGLAIYQPSWQFSQQRDFNGTVNVSADIYAPGGYNTAGTTIFEMFSLDAEEFVPGVDAKSNFTLTFDDAFAPGTAEFSGALATTDPTFNRPMQYGYTDGFGNPQLHPPELTGARPYYDAQAFTVSTAGKYTLVSANEFESSMVLYGGSFDPNNSLTNVMAAVNQGDNVLRSNALNNLPYLDDAVGASRIEADLVPGVTYYMVTTAFNFPGIETDGGPFIGRYKNLITGPGAVTLAGAVPEPASLGVLAAVGVLARRQRGRR
jgi:hypothetical protein